MAKDTEANIRYKTYLLFKSDQINVLTNKEKIINKPPIVGVPDFFLWDSGPSLRITSDMLTRENFLINIGPINNDITNNDTKHAIIIVLLIIILVIIRTWLFIILITII